MKATACLFAIVLAVLMVQPAFTNFSGKAASSNCTTNKPVKASCSKKKSKKTSCTKTKCSKPESKSKNCSKEHCNPLLGCPSGNFYIHNYSSISLTSFILLKQKPVLVNDNRIAKQLTECFHPPEIT